MNVDQSIKLDKICSTDFFRSNMKDIKFDGVHLIATNGQSIAWIKPNSIEPNQDKPAIIPKKAFKMAKTKGKLKSIIGKRITIKNKKVTIFDDENEITFKCVDDSERKFPDTEKLFKKAVNQIKDNCIILGINAKLLYNLSQAIGSTTGVVHLYLSKDEITTGKLEKGIKVKNTFNEGNIGLIMPVRVGPLD